MFVQLALGTGLILLTIVVSATAFWVLEQRLNRWRGWLKRAPHGPRFVFALCLSVFWTMVVMTMNVWIWALAFRWLDLFLTLEQSVYFALVAFTTLGFGDLLLAQDWRLLGGMAAANGLLNFGLMTAMLIESLRDLRKLPRIDP